MKPARLEAFSDGVIAVLITIMVLELKGPHEPGFAALRPLFPPFLAYVLSFIMIAIYWNNHHHMLHLTRRVTGSILWANLHLLFWLSLIPFTTSWVGENDNASVPTAIYGGVFLMSGIAWLILQQTIIRSQGEGSKLKAAIGRDLKGRGSGLLYAAAIPLAFVNPLIADAIFVAVAAMWLIPDRRMAAHVEKDD
jgi:uncharacterized membrane protein